MELLAKAVYHAPSFTLTPGSDTISLTELTDDRKAQMLEDYPETFEEIEDVEAYLAEKMAVLVARIEELAPVAVAEKENNPFATDPTSLMTAADRFENTTPEQVVAAKAPVTPAEKRAATVAAKKTSGVPAPVDALEF